MLETEVYEEIWTTIPDFPRYSVSNTGDVMNNRTEKLVKPQLTPQGVVYVPLFEDGDQHVRSVKVLVAKAFVEGETEVFDTPINKDGNKTNNHYTNLVWRPRWFAVKYSRQFLKPQLHSDVGPVYDDINGEQYLNVYEAATANGLLIRDVFRSTFSDAPVFPTWQVFRIPGRLRVEKD